MFRGWFVAGGFLLLLLYHEGSHRLYESDLVVAVGCGCLKKDIAACEEVFDFCSNHCPFVIHVEFFDFGHSFFNPHFFEGFDNVVLGFASH